MTVSRRNFTVFVRDILLRATAAQPWTQVKRDGIIPLTDGAEIGLDLDEKRSKSCRQPAVRNALEDTKIRRRHQVEKGRPLLKHADRYRSR